MSSILPAFAMLLLVLSACTSVGQSDESPSASAEAAQAGCPSLEVRGPDGAALDLNGTWTGLGERGATPWPGTYEFKMLNSCLAWVGQSVEDGEELGTSWRNVFIGTVNGDFTISGDWAVVSAGGTYCLRGQLGLTSASCSRVRGTLVLRIDWVETAEGNKVRLVLDQVWRLGARRPQSGVGYFMTGMWVRPGDEALFDVPVD